MIPAGHNAGSAAERNPRRIGLQLPGGVFWRTFFLIAALIGASMTAWFITYQQLVDMAPRARQIAQTMVSAINITRSALIHSDPESREALLRELAHNESIRIYPLEPGDKVMPRSDTRLQSLIQAEVRARLGAGTRFARMVNGKPGTWVSFSIDDDDYWITFDRDRIEPDTRLQWLSWSITAFALSLLGAIATSRLINQPLKRLTAASVALGRGKRPALLPVSGPSEIREANASFNAMVEELERVEADRALLLAGISHDLRTPLARLRLEIEMSPADEATRDAMHGDIVQMDAIISQFLDYARPPGEARNSDDINLAGLAENTVAELHSGVDLHITTDLAATPPLHGHATEIRRLILNLAENARRYGQTEGSEHCDLHISAGPAPDAPRCALLEIRDHGPGIPPQEVERLKRPFTRMNEARSQASGSGLGLAIVTKIAERHRARLDIVTAPGGGLLVRVRFPAVET